MATDDSKFLKGDSPSEEPGQHLEPDAAPPTGGDMLKSVYDTDDDGKVGSAQTADTATSANTATEAVDITGAASAGINHYYGTDSGGTPGLFALPILVDSAVWTGLLDTPSSYSGQTLKVVRVNAGETGLEFVTLGAGVTTYVALTDTPANFTGAAKQIPVVNAGETALEFENNPAEVLIWQGI